VVYPFPPFRVKTRVRPPSAHEFRAKITIAHEKAAKNGNQLAVDASDGQQEPDNQAWTDNQPPVPTA
jgi:hypothetical protein